MPQKKIKKSVTSQDGFFIKGKLPHHNDEAHGVRYKKPFYLGAFFGIFYLLSYTIPLLGLIYFLQNKSLHGLKVFGVGVILFLRTKKTKKHLKCSLYPMVQHRAVRLC